MGTGRIRATVVAICFFALGHGGAATAGRAQEGGASGTKQSVARSADATEVRRIVRIFNNCEALIAR